VANLAAVTARIASAAAAAAREPSELTLIGVTKFFPASDALLLADLGVTDLGESRDQEAAAKAAEVARRTVQPPRWHFLGRLQTNKARSVAGYAYMVHSVDRSGLVAALAAGRATEGDPLRVLIQVSLDGDTDRGGALPAQVAQLVDEIGAKPSLQLAGVMAVAPITADPDSAFAELADIASRVRAEHPSAVVVSAGMSADLEAAIGHGATHLRIGTALLGRRSGSFR
jgi:pyridoxal phosphate enzyme (YggS family)